MQQEQKESDRRTCEQLRSKSLSGQGKPKPGPTAGDVKKMQEKLGQQLKEMKEKMEKGKQERNQR
jgi:hypothetical protein